MPEENRLLPAPAEPVSNPLRGRSELVADIRSILAERLFCDLQNVTLGSRLIGDLGVDSLDFIDLQFVLEDRLGIRFRKGEFFDVTQDWVTKDGHMMPEAMERFAEFMPALRNGSEPVPLNSFFEEITVETLVLIVERSLATQVGEDRT